MRPIYQTPKSQIAQNVSLKSSFSLYLKGLHFLLTPEKPSPKSFPPKKVTTKLLTLSELFLPLLGTELPYLELCGYPIRMIMKI